MTEMAMTKSSSGGNSVGDDSDAGRAGEIKTGGIIDIGDMAIDVEKVTVRRRLKSMFVPFEILKTRLAEQGSHSNDSETHVLVRPEAFRMLFYVGFMLYLLLGIVISTYFSDDFDPEDNPILDTFGGNNICIYFDNAPFTYISAALFMPLMILLLLFEVFDAIRVYDCYLDDGILTKKFITLYSVFTVFEVCTVLCFVQVFAVAPQDNIVVHTLPYLALIYAFWTLSLKRYMYFTRVYTKDVIVKQWHVIGGRIYVFGLFVSAAVKTFVILPNLFGAKLWEQDGMAWTLTLTAINERMFTFLVVLCPLFVYFMIGHSLRSLTFVINRNKINYQPKQ